MSAPADHQHDTLNTGFIATLRGIADAAGPDGLSVAAIVDRMDERAFGLLLLALALPCLVPGLPGAQIIAIPIFLLAAQVALGRREPWLPGWFLRAQVKKDWLDGIAGFAEKSLKWTERLSRPRLSIFASGLGERLTAIIMALAAVTIMLPITNTIPSLAITLTAIGFIQRDGAFTLAGTVLALAWIAGLALLIGGLIFGAGFAIELVRERAPFLLDWMGRSGG